MPRRLYFCHSHPFALTDKLIPRNFFLIPGVRKHFQSQNELTRRNKVCACSLLIRIFDIAENYHNFLKNRNIKFLYPECQSQEKILRNLKKNKTKAIWRDTPFTVLKIILLPITSTTLDRKEIHNPECVWSEKTPQFW